MRLDSVHIGVPDVGVAVAAYELLLDTRPERRPDGSARFSLSRGAVVLEAGEGALRSMRFVVDAPVAALASDLFNGLTVAVEPESIPVSPAAAGNVEAIDHVVVQSDDPDRAIGLWRDRMGLRLALDRVFEDRGLRLVFFRSGGITLEYASPHPASAEPRPRDRFYGLSYRVRDLARHRERLLASGLDVSAVRVGIRPGTSVATVRSGTAGVPTLLLQLDPGSGGA